MTGIGNPARSSGKKLFLLGVLVALLMLLFFNSGSGMAQEDPTISYTVRDDATGGDCLSFGTWDQNAKTCTLSQNLTFTGSGDFITIADDGITLDGGGFELYGAGSSTGIVLDGRNGVILRNLRCFSFATTIRLNSSSGNTIDGIFSSENIHYPDIGQDGILLAQSDNNSIINNVISSMSHTGIHLQNSSNNLLDSNSAAGLTGIWLENSNANTLSNNLDLPGFESIKIDNSTLNVVTGNHIGSSNGLTLNASSRTSITHNIFGYMPGQTLMIYDSENTEVIGNTFETSSPAATSTIFIARSNNTVIANNKFQWANINLETCNNSEISGNEIYAPFGNAITMARTSGDLVKNNYIYSGNLLAQQSHDFFIEGNYLYGAIDIDESFNSYISRNEIQGQAIRLSMSTGITVADNNLNSADTGIKLENSSNGNSLIRNLVSGSHMSGLFLDNSNDNAISSNSISGCGTGMMFFRSTGNILRNNDLVDNEQNLWVDDAAGVSSPSTLTTTPLPKAFKISAIFSPKGGTMLLAASTPPDSFDNDIDTTNMVNGKPIYYVKNASNQVFDSSTNAGVFYCINCSNVTIRNLVTVNNGAGIYLKNTSDSRVENVVSSNNEYGIYLDSSDGNIITGSTFKDNYLSNQSRGINLVGSNNNTIYSNTFSNNYQHAEAINSAGNTFDLPLPTGGNFWDTWTTPDNDNNGFIDEPFVFTGGEDNLPLVSPPCYKPDLVLSMKSGAYWASYADYQSGLLSVGYVTQNYMNAYDLKITGASSTGGVTAASVFPLQVGDVSAGLAADFTLMYHIPSGVAVFRTTVYASVRDTCGNLYEYPGTYPES